MWYINDNSGKIIYDEKININTIGKFDKEY